ncbi:tail fiber protein, partial [Escherichia coli]|nr:tail fiber protein [Escherichia coli]
MIQLSSATNSTSET